MYTRQPTVEEGNTIPWHIPETKAYREMWWNHRKKNSAMSLSRGEKKQVLTAIPESWSICRVVDEFVSAYNLTYVAKLLQDEKNCLSDPNP